LSLCVCCDGKFDFVFGLAIADDLQVDGGDSGAAGGQVTAGVKCSDYNAVIGQCCRVVIGRLFECVMLAAFDAYDLDLAGYSFEFELKGSEVLVGGIEVDVEWCEVHGRLVGRLILVVLLGPNGDYKADGDKYCGHELFHNRIPLSRLTAAKAM